MLKRVLFLVTIVSLALAGGAAPTTPQTPIKETVEVPVTVVVPGATTVVTAPPEAMANSEAIIEGVEPGAEITIWTFYLSPTFDQYIKDTITRFNEAYP